MEDILQVCEKCNKLKKCHKLHTQLICRSCYQKYFAPKIICVICGKEGFAQKYTAEGPICISCYQKQYIPPKRTCSICSQVGKINKIKDGKPICTFCYNNFYIPRKNCCICNEEKPISKKIGDKNFCKTCYSKFYVPKKICSICNEEKIINLKIGDKNICKTCYNKYYIPKKVCSICSKEGIINKKIDDKNICKPCYDKLYRAREICSICNRVTIVNIRIEGKPICQTCYYKFYKPRSICSVCGNSNIIEKVIEGKNICRSCYNKSYRPIKNCTICGNSGYIVGRIGEMNLCNKCWLKTKTDKYIIEIKDKFNNEDVYKLFANYISDCQCNRSPERTLIIANVNLEFFLYLDSNYTEKKLSYNYFEELCNKTNCCGSNNLRNYFYKLGILEEVDNNERFNDYCKKLSLLLKQSFGTILLKYADSLIKRRINFNNKGWTDRFTLLICKRYVLYSYVFLDNISKKVETIYELNDEVIDEFFSIKYYNIIHFLKWLNKNIKLFRKITVPKKQYSPKQINPYSEEELETILESLNNINTSERDKVICLLVLFYALCPNDLQKLKLNDYKIENNTSFLFIRGIWMRINLYISKSIENYIKIERTSKYALGHSQEWLFFGHNYNKPMSMKYIDEIVHKYKISIKRALHTLVINSFINNEILPGILIQGLGLNRATVMDYYTILNVKNIYETHSDNNTLNNILSFSSNYYVYVLKCIDGSYYTGYTANLNNRLIQHQKRIGCSYTKTRTPVKLVYYEEFTDKPSALKREKQIKKLTIFEKERLIETRRVN